MNLIWCEVSCCKCGEVIGFYYKNTKTISRLKELTKDWNYCEDTGTLCPKCYQEWKRKEDK